MLSLSKYGSQRMRLSATYVTEEPYESENEPHLLRIA